MDWTAQFAPSYFNNRKVSIYGGSNEIQRNIITKAVLGFESPLPSLRPGDLVDPVRYGYREFLRRYRDHRMLALARVRRWIRRCAKLPHDYKSRKEDGF